MSKFQNTGLEVIRAKIRAFIHILKCFLLFQLTHERNALNRFLLKFETQFDNYDYERLVQEAKDIQLNQRMVQQRLTITHEEAQKKLEKVKEFLLKDVRLNLPA